jgi:hypothetical protein|tara:strand:+ start:327 stop:986 length:660 start_codon:yes stop_codon:yes gene_type:complete
MGYFKELPDLLYPSLLPKSTRSDEKIRVKNLFRRAKIRTDANGLTLTQLYQVPEGERPEMTAEKLYEDPELDWIILTVNNITSVRNQWPLTNDELQSYLLEKYGSQAALTEPHHYETKEIRDTFGRVVLNKGLIVDENFTFTYSSNTGTEITDQNASGPVSNFVYETIENNKKRLINVLKREFLSVATSDLREIMTYGPSSQFITDKLKDTYNPRITGV